MSRLFSHPGKLTIVARITITLLISIIIPLVSGLATNSQGVSVLNPFEQFMLGGLVFLAMTLTTVSHEISEILRLRQREHQLWEIRYPVDAMLSNMRTAFIKILGEGPLEENLFAQYFQRVLSQISDSIYQASTKQELRVDELTFGTTDLLLAIFERRACDTLRFIHALDSRPNNFDFSPWSRSYYRELTRLSALKKISIQRLFIFGSQSDLADPMAQKLFAFHATNEHHDFRIISRADWTAIVRGHNIPEGHAEFGVWGDILVYTALRSSAVHMEGSYISLPQAIARFREVFDAGWRLGTTLTDPSSGGHVSVDDLFKNDPVLSTPESVQRSTALQMPESRKSEIESNAGET